MKPLTLDDASPCMKCGSIQCAFCSDDVLSALELAKKKGKKRIIDMYYNKEMTDNHPISKHFEKDKRYIQGLMEGFEIGIKKSHKDLDECFQIKEGKEQ